MKKIIYSLLAVALLTLSGCQGKNTGSSTSSTNSSAQASSSQTEGNFPLTYKDDLGREVTIEEQPKRIVTNYMPQWEALIKLGIMPVGVTGADNYLKTWEPFKDLSSEEQTALKEVADLGSQGIDPEKVAATTPDLILLQSADAAQVESLEQIAPVIVLGTEAKMDWRFCLEEIGKITGTSSIAEKVITETNATLKKDGEELASTVKDKTVIDMSIMGKNRYFCTYREELYDKETGLGLAMPEGYSTKKEYVQLTVDTIAKMNPDYIFINVFDTDEALYEELINSSVWKSLKAAKNNHVFKLPGSGHSLSALSTIDTVARIKEDLMK